MKKVVILGCENSHADTFLKLIQTGNYPEIEVVGVYSDDRAAAEKLNAVFGVAVMDRYDQAVGQADGVMVTARHGDNHLKYAAPYIPSGVPMFMDKPVTVKEAEAVAMMEAMKAAGVRVTGGSSCRHIAEVETLKAEHEAGTGGKTLGGFVRAPISLKNDYGDFYFYAEHLVDILMEIYGWHPESITAFQKGEKITAIFHYADFDVTGLYVDGNYTYFAERQSSEGVHGEILDVTGASPCFRLEFEAFYDLLLGGKQKVTYENFIAPVFAMNAICRSLASGKTEKLTEYEVK